MKQIIRFWQLFAYAGCAVLLGSCEPKLIKWQPDPVKDTDDLEISCDASQGNKGLKDFSGAVYIHLGLITSKSRNDGDWRFVKFQWGSKDFSAIATPVGKDKWTYHIKNVRKFFGVNLTEKIYKIEVLFRSGGCRDLDCYVLRNGDNSNMYIPVIDNTVTR